MDRVLDVNEAFMPFRRNLNYRLGRRLKDKLMPTDDALLITRKSRKKRSRRKSLLFTPVPRKILGSRFRKR